MESKLKEIYCWILLLTSLVQLISCQTANELLEYCERDKFVAECGENEVIMVQIARYGRMREGRCISQQAGHLGCSTDALPFLDVACSGRRECEAGVADLIPEDKQPCSKDYRSYLEARYICIKVSMASKEMCHQNQKSEAIIGGDSGYLSSMVSMETGAGSIDCPWKIEMKPGQKVKIRLIDFTSIGASQGSGVCHVFAIIKEPSSASAETICGGGARNSVVFTSQSNVVEVRVVTKQSQEKNGYFLLKYEAIGCPNYENPSHGWFKRNGDTAEWGCDSDGESWKITCADTAWSGPVGNCTPVASESDEIGASGIWGSVVTSNGMSVMIVVTIAVVIGVLMLVVGLFCIRRHRQKEAERLQAMQPAHYDVYSRQGPNKGLHSEYSKPYDPHSTYSTENDYFRTWQMQRPSYLIDQATGQAVPVLPSRGWASDCSNGYSGNNGRYTEHVYESPKFERKELGSPEEIPTYGSDESIPVQQYFTLDPESVKQRNEQGPSSIITPSGDLVNPSVHGRNEPMMSWSYVERDGPR